jgi:nitrate/nitrite transport system ATP-binding protein
MSSSTRYLEFSKISKVFVGPSGPQMVVKDFELKVAEGELVSIIGHSGCGKSTVLSMAAGLQTLTRGAIIVAGKEVVGPGPDRGVVFQSPSLFHWMSALQNVVIGVEQVRPGASREEHERIARHYLRLVGLEDSIAKRPAELSSGMRQRVGLARAFALTPRVLLLDEPFGMLDSLTRMELQEVLLSLWRQDRKTALMVTHDVDEALFLSDRVVMMTQGPEAKVGDTLRVPFARPRDRRAVMNDPLYYELRERIIGFLETNAPQRTVKATPAEAAPSEASAIEALA